MEKYISLFEQYGKVPEKIYRGRQMIIGQCDGRIYALSERRVSLGKITREHIINEYLINKGFTQIDQYVKNVDGEYEVFDKYHTGYIMRENLELMDYQYLYVMLLYPDKFWKISNHYYNSKKTWVPPKNIEKLNNVLKQNESKKKCLQEFHDLYLA